MLDIIDGGFKGYLVMEENSGEIFDEGIIGMKVVVENQDKG